MFEKFFKNVTVVGAQKSGLAAAVLLKSRGARVRLTENKEKSRCPADTVRSLEALGIPLEFGGHSPDAVGASDLLVLSPGVPCRAEVARRARARGIPVLTEVELAYQFCSRPVIGITGSNGKTTVTTLVHRVLTRAGYRTALCGNIGTPFSEVVQDDDKWDYYVVELSSFQTEAFLDPADRPASLQGFRPRVAAVLNFSQNHLDRHDDMADYLLAKKRIFLNQTKEDYAVLNGRDKHAGDFAEGLSAAVRYFDPDGPSGNPNQAAVETVTGLLGVPAAACRSVFESFPGVRHRLQEVGVIDGVAFINDSKSTTIEATRWALERLEKPVRLICGGRDKQLDFTALRDDVRRKVRKIYAIGEAADKLARSFEGTVDVQRCAGLEDAVRQSFQQARAGDVVLLSPMCASFDMFLNFEDRGDVFCGIVDRLQRKTDPVSS
jgi:UDP-N-acetylmuramoylalanine--D-glutamate ligase